MAAIEPEIETVIHEGERYFRIDPVEVALEAMDKAQKIADVFAYQLPEGAAPREIATVNDGVIETSNMAQPGDWIVYNIGGAEGETLEEKLKDADVKVIREEDFPKLYALDEEDESDYSDYEPIFQGAAFRDAGVYKYVGEPVYVARVPFNFVLRAPWGQDQFIREGGHIVYNPNTSAEGQLDIYGIQGAHFRKSGEFEKTYTKVGDGDDRPIDEGYKHVIAADRSPISGVQFNSQDLDRAYKRIGKDWQHEKLQFE